MTCVRTRAPAVKQLLLCLCDTCEACRVTPSLARNP